MTYLIEKTELKDEDIKTFVQMALDSTTVKNEQHGNKMPLDAESLYTKITSMLFFSARIKLDEPRFKNKKSLEKYLNSILKEMEQNELIESKLVEKILGMPIMMMGLAARRFYKKTKKGQNEYLKVLRELRSIEIEEKYDEGDYQHHYRIYSLWRSFKSSLFLEGGID